MRLYQIQWENRENYEWFERLEFQFDGYQRSQLWDVKNDFEKSVNFNDQDHKSIRKIILRYKDCKSAICMLEFYDQDN